MKILKLPIDTKINCVCGCEFEFEADDVEQVGYTMYTGSIYNKVVVDCPFCKYRHVLHEKMIERKLTNTEDENI